VARKIRGIFVKTDKTAAVAACGLSPSKMKVGSGDDAKHHLDGEETSNRGVSQDKAPLQPLQEHQKIDSVG